MHCLVCRGAQYYWLPIRLAGLEWLARLQCPLLNLSTWWHEFRTRGSRGWARAQSCCWAVVGALLAVAQCCGEESWGLSSCRSISSGWGAMLFISMGCVHVCRVPPRHVSLQPHHSPGDLFSGQLLPTVKWLPGECLAEICFWRGSVTHLHKVVENLLLPRWTNWWSRCPLQVLRSYLRWLNVQLWFSFYNFFHFCWRQSTVYFPTCQSADTGTCLKWEGMHTYCEEEHFFLQVLLHDSTFWGQILMLVLVLPVPAP